MALLSQYSYNSLPVGSILQTVYVETTARQNITGVIPEDDNIPQITQGTEVLTLNITPTSVNNKILLTSVACIGHTGNYRTACCLFRAGTNNALSTVGDPGAPESTRTIIFVDSPNTTSQLTYSLRVGSGTANTTLLNDYYSFTSKYGQTMRTLLMAQEIKG